MKIRPLHDRVIVKRLEEERKTAGGIVIPDTAAEKPSQGEIVFAGPGKTDDNGKLIPMGVKVGDKILFGKYSGQEFKMDGNDYLHMRDDVVFAHMQVIVAVHLEVLAGVFSKQNLVADFHAHRNHLPVVVGLAGPGKHNFTLRGFFGRGVGYDDAAGGLAFLLKPLDDHAIV